MTIPSSTSYIHSDSLAEWYPILASVPQLQDTFGLTARVRLVVDANVILQDLYWLVAKRSVPGARTNLQELLVSTACVAYAPRVLRDEVAKYIPKLAEECGLAEAAFWAEWPFYQEHIRFFDAPAIDLDPVAAARDPKDVPYIDVAVNIGAAAIYSRDPHIPAMTSEIGVHTATPDTILALREYARYAAVDLTITVGGMTIVGAGVGFTAWAMREIIRRVVALPAGIRVALGGAMILAIAHPRSRKVILSGLSTAGSALANLARDLLPILVEFGQQAATARRRAREARTRADTHLGRAVGQPARIYLLAAIAGARAPLDVLALVREMHALGYRSTARAPHEYVRRILRADPQFRQDAQGRWTTRATAIAA